MAMTSKEVMRAAIRFQTPDRLPVLMGALGFSDLHGIGLGHPSQRSETGVGKDEWGCVWSKTDMHNMGQVTGHPLRDLGTIEDYPFPDPYNPVILERIGKALPGFEAENKYVDVGQFMILFERMHSLLGFRETLEYLYLEPEAMGALADRIADYNVTLIHEIGSRFGTRIHAYGGTDDWGTQADAFISPRMWRSFFLPRYRRIFDAAKKYDWDVRLHSCGKVNALLPLFIGWLRHRREAVA